MNFLYTLAAFALALGILVVVHEFGHFLAARLSGVKVLRFCVGFGKPLWKRAWGADRTEWAIAAFPLGGYVKMLDEREGEVAASERHRAFNRQPVHTRFLIVVAGPTANLVLAVLLYFVLFVHGVPGLKPVLGPVLPGTAAARAGLAAGDTIESVAGHPVPSWSAVRWQLLKQLEGGKPVALSVKKGNGGVAHLRLGLAGLGNQAMSGDLLTLLGLSVVVPSIPAKIGAVLPASPAARAGLEAGDTILAVNGHRVANWDDVVGRISVRPGQRFVLAIGRAGAVRRIVVVAQAVRVGTRTIGRIGVAPDVSPAAMAPYMVTIRYAPWEALESAVARTWNTSRLTLTMLGEMVVGKASWHNISGPITIADLAGQSAKSGWLSYFEFIALVSISLGVLNLLPVPLLDGGHLMYYIVELIKGSPVSERAMEIGQRVGMALLITLMTFAFYNDIQRLLTGQ
ncbi:MAG: RIP metalloprotease RseP [Betaproteobacteria bacterium]|nr:RIP metalloprotease RseP [Betaproteobacteria bacterium]